MTTLTKRHRTDIKQESEKCVFALVNGKPFCVTPDNLKVIGPEFQISKWRFNIFHKAGVRFIMNDIKVIRVVNDFPLGIEYHGYLKRQRAFNVSTNPIMDESEVERLGKSNYEFLKELMLDCLEGKFEDIAADHPVIEEINN